MDFSSGGGVPLPVMILAGRSQMRNPCEVRSSLSQSPSRCRSLQPAGRTTATGSFYASARYVNEIRLSVMAAAASRLTTSTMTGFGSIAAAAPIAGPPLLSFLCSLFPTRISVCLRAARHCGSTLRSTVLGRRRPRSSWILTACPIRQPSGAGRAASIVFSRRFPFSARPSPV